jgi:hypothetical protein
MANARNFSLVRNIQTSSGAYTVSYSICMGGFPKRKVARGKIDHFPPTRAKVSGDIILFLLHAFMARRRKALFVLPLPY